MANFNFGGLFKYFRHVLITTINLYAANRFNPVHSGGIFSPFMTLQLIKNSVFFHRKRGRGLGTEKNYVKHVFWGKSIHNKEFKEKQVNYHLFNLSTYRGIFLYSLLIAQQHYQSLFL